MRASALEFRLRVLIHTVLIILGFWAPWIEYWHLGQRISLLEWLALELSRLGVVSFAAATPFVIVLATLIAALSVWLRVWGTAYLNPDIVYAGNMNADSVMSGGPYRYVRNPLYLGVILMVAAMAFAMPVSGAILVLILAPLFDFRLILGE
jgi:protein-S-isoprenylcysteine O-methyltransferase Ste14